jgi:rod shape-determining protein MreC
MVMLRSTSGARRVLLVLFALLLSSLFLLPKQSRGFFQTLATPLGQMLALPLEGLASVDRSVRDLWDEYIAVRKIRDENRVLRKEIRALRAQNAELRERASASERLAGLLELKERQFPQTVAAQVLGRDTSNWYRALIVDKGERDGVREEMGVIAPAGVVGRVVKTTASTALVLLLTDPSNAIAALIQRTRDEGIVEGTAQGLARIKYVPLLARVQAGDRVVTSGLTGNFPKGLAIGAITSIEKAEGDLFQAATIAPEVDFSRLEEVLVLTNAPEPALSLAPTERKP